MTIDDILNAAPVMPVIVLDDPADAEPLARALVAGGLRVLEVTLRTPAALDAVRIISQRVPDAIVGVGTLSRHEQWSLVQAAGARFAVSPGLTPALVSASRESGLPFLPGVFTPSEAMQAREAGFDRLKLFPAAQAGGIGMLRALASPLPDLVFCPTGGIDADSFRDYLAQPNVACVGGSWVAPKALIEAGDWASITALASAATT